MKELLKRSIRYNNISTIIAPLVSILLIGLLIFQSYHYNKLMSKQSKHYNELIEQQVSFYQNILEEQMDDYMNLLKAEEPVKNNKLPKRSLGRFMLSWYSPKELGKESASQLRTSRGLIPKEGRTIAVDPKVIPYGTTVYIEGYGYFIAEDCGGAIKGNRIDIFTNSHSHAISQGRKVANVWIISKKK